ncbi:MAG TPA: NUDIX hydrolase [Acidimicrobiales bacterium]
MGGFRRLGETELLQAARFSVSRGRYAGPDGSEFERDIVHHPGAVGIVPLHDDGTVTLVRQYRAALDADLLELPAGLRDVAGEPDAGTAARELAEEVGLAADKLYLLVTFLNSPGYCDESVSVFLATGLHEVADDRQGVEEEAMEVLRVPLDEALGMIDSGAITDAKTVIGLTLTARRV